ncbi:sensor histidine kinase [Streptomyces sp. NBC_01217]|uniref:sensor histidine kinase n=1 Tax=Streptomyces sp. NBC_01217 TaxID=2903779 RepID=UPI002E0ED6C6|nr:sensor histidine kinase [Streptomyces sp. NBC_01217]
MKRGDVARRSAQALRALPRILREDLVTSAVGPTPHEGRPRWLEWRPALMVPMVMCAVGVLIVDTNQYAFGYRVGIQLGIPLAGIQSAALVVALFRPVLAWWATVLVMVVLTPFAANAGPFGATFPWNGTVIGLQAAMLFLLALRVRPRTAAQALTISVVAGLVCGTVNPWRQGGVGIAVAVLVIAVVVGAALRGIGVARTQLVVQEELTAEERARRTLLEERNRIARELHDVVAHHMSVISIQAQVAPHLVENPSEELRENLAGIRENAVDALTELRRVLGVLRSEEPVPQAARHTPQPTLDRLDELIGNARGAGLTVTAETTGEPRPLAPGVELSAYRIVQEALSNAMRHAPGAQVRVEIGHHRSGVTVRVTNAAPDRAAPASAGAGHGLLGMRERTAMLGGDLATGATPDGGYEVTATLPAQPLPGIDGLPPR